MKEEIFITFGDPRNREAVKESVPGGFFINSCEKGLVWALKLDYMDITNTLVSMALTAANNASVLLIFKSDDYHKVDKVKWESAISTDQYNDKFTGTYKYLGYIDDDIDDKHAEYLVSYESLKPVSVVPSYLVMTPENFSVDAILKMFEGGRTEGADDFEVAIRDTFSNSLKANKELLKQTSFDLVENTSGSSAKNALNSGMIITLFTMLYAPIVLTPIANGYRKMNGIDDVFPVYSRMGDIALKNAPKLFNLLNSAVYLYENGINGYEEYDRIYDSIYTLLNYKESWLFDALLSGIGRNDPCPCGSGKKWKQCHGKN